MADSIEQEIQAKGLNAPRVTPADVEASITSEHYFTAADGRCGAIQSEAYSGVEVPQADGGDIVPLGLITFCVLILKNGHRIVGINEGPVSAANFDAGIGKMLARDNAKSQIWPLLGYELRSKLAKD